MWWSKVYFILLLFELNFIALYCLPKPETNKTEIIEIKELPNEAIEFINSKPDEPVIREIFVYHIVEKPYLKKGHKNSPDSQEPDFDQSMRPFTNGQGYQFLDPQSEEPKDEDADDKDIKIKRDFAIDSNDTTIPIHVGNTNKIVEGNLDKNNSNRDETTTQTTENIKEQSGKSRRKRDIRYQPVMGGKHQNVIYTNSPKNMQAENEPFKNKVRKMFDNLQNAKQTHTYGMSLHNGFGNVWNNLQYLPFINKIGSVFNPKIHNKDEIQIENIKDIKPVVNDNPIAPYITKKEIPPVPEILELINIKSDTTRRPTTIMEDFSNKVLSSNKSQDLSSDPSFTTEKDEIRPGNIYVIEIEHTSNKDTNDLPVINNATDDSKGAFVNQNNDNINNENKVDEAKDKLQSDVEETEISPDIPINTGPIINGNTKEKNDDSDNNKPSSFYEKIKKSFKKLLNKLSPFKRKPFHGNKDEEYIASKSIPTTIDENNSGTYGMRLKNNGGFVWNELDPNHGTFINVGETPLVDKKDHIPTEANTEPVVLSHFNDNIVKTTSPTTTTNVHTNKQTDSLEITTKIPNNTENTSIAKNVETTTDIQSETTKGNDVKVPETNLTTTSDIITPKLTTLTTNSENQNHIIKTTVLTTTEEIKTTTKQSTFNVTEKTTDIIDEISTTEHGGALSNIITTTDVHKEANTENVNQHITTQTSSTSITTIVPEKGLKGNSIESTTTTNFNKTTEKISEPNAKNATSTKSNTTSSTTESTEQVNSTTTEAKQQSKNLDNIPQTNDTKSHSKGESIKSDLNKLLEKKVFWDWLTAWTSAYLDMLYENVKELVKAEVAEEIKNITELFKNRNNTSSKPEVVSPTISKADINSTANTNENSNSQNVTHIITTSKPSANESGIKTNETMNSKNVSGITVAGDTINGNTVDVTNIFIFMNDNQNNTLIPIMNKTLKDVNETKKNKTESTDNVTAIVTTTPRTVISEKDKEKASNSKANTSNINNNNPREINQTTITNKNNTDSSLNNPKTSTSAPSEITAKETTKSTTISYSTTTEKIQTTIHQPNSDVTSPSTETTSSEKPAVTSGNINATSPLNNQAITSTETILTALTTIGNTSTTNPTSVTESLTTKSANISTEMTTLTTLLENTTTTTELSTTESVIGNLSTTRITPTGSSTTPVNTSATESLKSDSTDSSTTPIDIKSSNASTTTIAPVVQNNTVEHNTDKSNNTSNSTISNTEVPSTISSSSHNTDNNLSTEATTTNLPTTVSDSKIGTLNVTTASSIANATLISSTVKQETSSASNTTTASSKDTNLTTEVTTIKSTNTSETETTKSEEHSTTVANNSTTRDSALTTLTTVTPNSTVNSTESLKVENSSKTTTQHLSESTTISNTVSDKNNKSTTSPKKR